MILASTKHQRAMKRIKISFVLLLSAMVLIVNLPAFANANVQTPGKIYYVAPTGSDQNDGSQQAPWKSLQHAANVVKAGETVFVRGGTYKENIVIKSSGSATLGYITFQAYPGETPIISGESTEGTSLVYFNSAHYIVFDGFELTDFEVSDSSKFISAIKVRGESSNLVIQNNHIHKINHLANKGNANGIIVYGNSKQAISNITISNNYLHDLILGSSEALTVVGNVDGFRIENNVIERVNNIAIDAAGFYGTCSSDCIDQARNGVIAGNVISYVDTIDNPVYGGARNAAGIYVDGGTKIVIERNRVAYSNYGLSISSEHTGQAATEITVRNNYIHNNQKSGIIMGGSSSSKGGATNNMILNNTFISNNELRRGDGEITFQNAVKNNVFANNLLVTNVETPYFYDNKTTNTGNIMDYNLYHAEDEQHSYWRLGDVRYTDFEKYQAATKQDLNSIVGEPSLQRSGQNVIELASTSLAIDNGTLQYRQIGELDIAGNSRVVGDSVDIGAREFTGVIEPPATEPPATEPPASSPPVSVPNSIVVDGLSEDWKALPDLATSSSNVRSMKSVIVNDTLYVMITGQLLKEKSQLYIMSGEQASFNVPFWSNQKANYLLEDGILYRYTGSGKNWSWSKVKDYRKNGVVIHSSAIELGIPLRDMNSSGVASVQLGYIWNDSKSDQLPAGGAMVTSYNAGATGDDGGGQTPSYPVPNPVPSITINGDLSDWSQFLPLAKTEDGTMALYAAYDEQSLYVAMNAAVSAKKLQIFLNTDNNAATGLSSSKWKTSSGADYLIENGRLYKYGGDTKSWVFTKQLVLDQQSYRYESSILEMKVSLQQLGIGEGSTISLGVMLDDQVALKLPQSASFVQYDLRR